MGMHTMVTVPTVRAALQESNDRASHAPLPPPSQCAQAALAGGALTGSPLHGSARSLSSLRAISVSLFSSSGVPSGVPVAAGPAASRRRLLFRARCSRQRHLRSAMYRPSAPSPVSVSIGTLPPPQSPLSPASACARTPSLSNNLVGATHPDADRLRFSLRGSRLPSGASLVAGVPGFGRTAASADVRVGSAPSRAS